MFGLFCKGLHCAGCGKGIPAAIVGVIIVLVFSGALKLAGAMGEIVGMIETASLYIGIGLALCGLATVLGIRAITRVKPVMAMRWQGPTMCETKADADEYGELVSQWPDAIPAYQFAGEHDTLEMDRVPIE